ncbi:DUF3488 and transglutaminase-like domain-containing protein [Streptomyces sp. NPDC049555]|uniref:transglutaminase family protein n=1 Tax=Streptomyces sp. NPDC049555 TaxID=3154930 RepID=UPI00342121B5
MSGRTRLAICGLLATLAASCAMLPLVERPVWAAQAAVLLALQTAVGAATRRVPLARWLTLALQAASTVLLLTLAFARSRAVAGVLPGPDALAALGDLLQQGAQDVGRYAIPAPATPGIRLLLVGGVLAVGLVVDALAVTFRSAAPAGLPLLALYSIGAGLAKGHTGWLWFLTAAGGYLLLLLAEGRDRLARWGRVFPAGTRPPGFAGGPATTAGGPALAPVRTGRRIAALSLGIALALPAVLPSIGGGLLGARGRSEGDGPGGGTISAVNPLVSLQNSLNQPENREVLRYRSTSQSVQDLYLRIVALDRFDGASWRASERRITDVPSPLPTPAGLSPATRVTPVGTSVAAAAGYGQNYLPMPYPAAQVTAPGKWRYEPAGRTLVGDHGQTTRGVRYQVTSLHVEPTAAQLAAAPAPPEDLLREYTKVPSSLPAVVAQTAREVTAGAANAYEQAVRLQDWFAVSGGFRYDTEAAAGGGTDALARFLRDRQGFCVHFSFSMAAMARTLGIPARVAVGFTPGTPQSDGSVSVGTKDAHAWPELYFEGAGWTRFEPTPSRGTTPDYSVAQQAPVPDPGAPQPAPRPRSVPSGAPAIPQGCPPELKKLDGCTAPAPQAADGGADTGPGPLTVVAVVLAALAALLLPALPLLWRVTVRGRRLGGKAPEPTLAAWRELTDSAWDYGALIHDDALTPRMAVDHLARTTGLAGAPAEAAGRVAVAVEQVLYAPPGRADATDVTSVTADVAVVRDALRASAQRRARIRAVLAPRSAVRLLWAARARWARTTARLRRHGAP